MHLARRSLCRGALLLGVLLSACGDDEELPPDAAALDAAPRVDAFVADAARLTCEAPRVVSLGTFSGDLVPGTSLLAPNPAPGSPCDLGAGPEAVYRFTLDHEADVLLSVIASFDSVSYVRAECASTLPDDGCADTVGSEMSETAALLDAAPGVYSLIVDGYRASDFGAFVATVSLREIVGLNEYCDDKTTRCADGLSCIGNSCLDTVTYCDSQASPVSLGTPTAGNTGIAYVDLTSCEGSGTTIGEDAYDQLWQLPQAAAPTLYSVHVVSSEFFYPVAYATRDCANAARSTSCNPATPEVYFDVAVGAGERVWVVVDGTYPGEAGPYTITVDEVHLLAEDDPCDPDRPVIDRCPAGDACNGTVCRPIAEVCAALSAGALSAGVAASGDTTGGTAYLECAFAYEGREQLWSFTPATSGTYVAELSSSRPKSVYLSSDCVNPAGSTSCADAGTDIAVDSVLVAGTPVHFVVDSLPGEEGAYTLTVNPVTFLGTGAACDPALARTVRCPEGEFCDTAAGSVCAPLPILFESEPNDTPATADVAAGLPTTAQGEITPGDTDTYKITVTASGVLQAQTDDGPTSTCESYILDSYLTLSDVGGTVLAENDDGYPAWCSLVSAAVGPGTYTITVTSSPAAPAAAFTYTLLLSEL